MKKILPVLLLALVSVNAFAAASVPANTCKKPKVLSRVDQGDINETKRFDRDFSAYKVCMQKYIADNVDLAKAHEKAAVTAHDEFNAFVAKANGK